MSSVTTLPRRASFVGSQSEWFSIGFGLWVALSSGLHQGRIESRGTVFIAVDDLNSTIGEFPTLRDAMAAVEAHSASLSAAA
jgi:hypothetical protein